MEKIDLIVVMVYVDFYVSALAWLILPVKNKNVRSVFVCKVKYPRIAESVSKATIDRNPLQARTT